MTDDTAIKVENLSKCYQIYDQPRHRLMQMLWRGHKQFYREFWALKDVSFEIRKGETVGIIGSNGCGKSTLLQLVCGTQFPTYGRVQTWGRIAALLELGAGFNPDFSGHENIYLNASLLGLTEREINACYDEIVAFAGIGDFIHQPISTYSSGMVVRLAFAVQVQIQPDILVIDEALAVGDEAFQRKCFQRLEELKAQGVSVLFVSHDAGAVVQICDRVIMIHGGLKLLDGSPKPVVSLYQKLLFASPEARSNIIEEIRSGDCLPPDRAAEEEKPTGNEIAVYDPTLVNPDFIEYSGRGASISHVRLVDRDDVRVNILTQGKKYKLLYQADFSMAANRVAFGMMIKTISGLEIGGASTDPVGQGDFSAMPHDCVQVEIEFTCSLNPGTYFMNTGIMGETDNERTYLARRIDALIFRVQPVTPMRSTGLVNFQVNPQVKLLAP